MKSKLLTPGIALFLAFYAFSSQASNLVQVYGDAIAHDPTFQKAEATWHAQQQNLPIALSTYLPHVDITGNILRQYQHTKLNLPLPGIVTTTRNTYYEYQITATQPIFNAPNWFNIRSASAGVKAATAVYSLSAQNLMLRTAQKYFAVLQAYDQLITTQASKRSYYREYITAKEKYEVGLIARTGVYEAQSFYDAAIATELADQNNLYNKIEELRAITGVHYSRLNGILDQVPLIIPRPNDINVWVQTAQSQNYGLISDEFLLQAAHETIRSNETGSLPQISAQGTWQQSDVIGRENLGSLNTLAGEQATGGLTMNFPLIQGGYVVASTRQAIYQYAESSAQLELDDRTTVTNTRQSFLGIVSGVGQVKADKLAIISAEKALEATRAGYSVGTQTMQDVLIDTSNLYKAKQRYFDDQYLYIINIFNLKYAAGTLSPEDLDSINRWLKKVVQFSLPKKLFQPEALPDQPLQTEKANVPIEEFSIPVEKVEKPLQLAPPRATK